MLNNIKKIIAESAYHAVEEAEQLFGSNMGAVKKEAAISFVLEALPVPFFVKPLIRTLLAKVIDEAIEEAVIRLKSFTQTLFDEAKNN